MPLTHRPAPSEHHEYYRAYIDRVPDGDILETLERQVAVTASLLRSVPADLETHRYRPESWTVRDVVGHVIDAERVFALRALHFARRDPAPLPSFEQDDWARASNSGRRPLAHLVDELEAVRRSHLILFRGFDGDVASHRGIASGREFTVRALVWMVAGHELHHVAVLRERYLVSGLSA